MATVPTAAELQYEREHYDETQVPALLASNLLFLSLAVVAVVIRFLCRWVSKIKYQYDDWFIVAGLILSAAVIASQLIGIRYGAGRHSVVTTTTTTSDKGFTRTLLAVEVTYQAATFCIKASILYLYHRVFYVSRRFTIILWVVAIFTFLYSSVQGLGALIQCVPTSAQWDPMIKRHCFPIDTSVIIFAVCNVLTDFIILILPMPLLWGLKQPLEQKLKLMAMFALGGLQVGTHTRFRDSLTVHSVCFASIYRATIIQHLSRIDSSWKDIPAQTWTAIEMGMGVLSVCLPTYKPLFNRIIPKFKAKFSSQDSREAPVQHPPPVADITLDTLETTTSEIQPPAPALGLRRERSKPSQSSEFAHIGILGSSLDLEEGRREEAVGAMKPD